MPTDYDAARPATTAAELIAKATLDRFIHQFWYYDPPHAAWRWKRGYGDPVHAADLTDEEMREAINRAVR